MSFYTINSPGNRNEEVKKYLELKNYLRTRDRAEKTGDFTRLEGLSKFFKPVSQPIEELKKNVKTLPAEIAKALPLSHSPVLPGLTALTNTENSTKEEKEEEENTNIELIKEMVEDRTKNKDFIDYKNGNFLINNKILKIFKDTIEYEGETYDKSPVLMNLIILDNYTTTIEQHPEAVSDYNNIMLDSGLMFVRNKKGTLISNQRLSQLKKWKLLKKTYAINREKIIKQEKEGKGHKQSNNKTVFLSSNPVTLADRLALLCASSKAGNTGLRNEMVEICKELVRMKAMTTQQKLQILNKFNTN